MVQYHQLGWLEMGAVGTIAEFTHPFNPYSSSAWMGWDHQPGCDKPNGHDVPGTIAEFMHPSIEEAECPA